MRRTTALCLGLVLLSASVRAQQPAAQAAEPSAARLRAHVTYLASDQLDGRRTGTRGAELAAEYISAEFKQLGLQPAHPAAAAAGRANPYLQQFPYVAGVELGRGNALTFSPRTTAAAVAVRVGADWTPLAWSANGRVERAPVTYVGYGITAADLHHDDYAGVNVRDRIALAFVGTPDGDNPHGQFGRYEDLRFKAAAARDHGARALVLISRAEDFSQDRRATLQLEDNAAGDAGLPVVLVSRQFARRAIAAAATPVGGFDGLERALLAPAPAPGATQAHAAAAHNFSTPLNNITFSLTTELVRQQAPAANVVGLLAGRDPQLRAELIIVGAHYDHLGRGGQGSLAPRSGEIHHGADDNASGVAALLELARLCAAAPLRRSVLFIAFSGEEEGLLGSNYYVNHPALPLAQTIAMINLDMVGRMQADKLIVGGIGTASEWRALATRANEAPPLTLNADPGPTDCAGPPPLPTGPAMVPPPPPPAPAPTPVQRFALTLNDDGYGPSDHASFYAKQVPVLFLWTGTHEDYHKPTDTAERLNYDGEARIVGFVQDLLRGVDAAAARPTYTVAKTDPAAGRSMGFRVYLGTIPSYADATDGLTLDGVRDDSPAARAGLRAGDRIVRLAGRDVRNVYDYTYALGELRPGQEYDLEVVRGTERLQLKITPAARN